MRRLAAVVVLAALPYLAVAPVAVAPGCGLFHAGEHPATPSLVASVKAALGVPDLSAAPAEVVRAEVAKELDEPVDAVRATPDGALYVTIEGAGTAVATKVGGSLAAALMKNPTLPGMLDAGMAALAAVYSLFQRRRLLA